MLVDDGAGTVLEDWTEPQVTWTMARGYPGAFGRAVNSPWIWLGLTRFFVLQLPTAAAAVGSSRWTSPRSHRSACPSPSSTTRRSTPPRRWPIRRSCTCWAACCGWACAARASPEPRHGRSIGIRALGAMARLPRRFPADAEPRGLQRHRRRLLRRHRRRPLADGLDLWGTFLSDNENGDTYGPVAYAAYLPFEQLMPWSGRWDALDAAHAGAIAWDLLCLALLWRIGRRLGGARLAVMLAYAWAACPFTLYVLNTNGNDGLVAALVLAAVRRRGVRPGPRGARRAGRLGEVRPFALAPLFAAHVRGGALRFAAGLAAVSALCAGACARLGRRGDLPRPHARASRPTATPFSIWGQWATAGTRRRSPSRAARSCSPSPRSRAAPP